MRHLNNSRGTSGDTEHPEDDDDNEESSILLCTGDEERRKRASNKRKRKRKSKNSNGQQREREQDVLNGEETKNKKPKKKLKAKMSDSVTRGVDVTEKKELKQGEAEGEEELKDDEDDDDDDEEDDEEVEAKEEESRPWQTLVSYVDELTLGGRKNSKGQYVDGMGNFPGFGTEKKAREPPECFPLHCYERCQCWDKCLRTSLGRKWTQSRRSVLSVVDTPGFEWFILVLIFASSVTLCFEDIHLDDNPNLKLGLYWTNLAFSVIFIVEMVLKWLALGFHKYFTSFWTLLDFLIVFVSIFE